VSHLLTTFFWNNASFSGGSQLNMGPFFVGTLNKLFRAEVRGQINYQGFTLSGTGVLANSPAWGLQQIAHGTSAQDVITSSDNDSWLMRRQTGSEDVLTAWTPTTNNGAVYVSNAIADDWAGQLAVGAATDLYLSIKTSASLSVPNYNAFGTIRIWWI
jgi:hypothetical protein